MCNKPLADYVKLPSFDEYKEWFKAFADLKREDGIVQVTWKTNDGPMHHSGMSHFLPGGGTEYVEPPVELVYFILEGELTIIDKDGKEKLWRLLRERGCTISGLGDGRL